nr:hypothetical protein [Tanacetum cinerariifolium]
EEDDQEIDEPKSDINSIRKSYRTCRALDRMCLYINVEEHELGDLGEPANYKDALLDPESKKWLDVLNVEMQSMEDNDVWVLVELPPNARTFGSKWLLKKKTDMDEVYMEQPEGFVNPKYPNHVCKLKRSIYGLKQASRQWNKIFDDEIKKFGFTQNSDEPCVYLKASGSYIAILILYVDDILLMGNNMLMLQDVKSYLGRSFAMKDLGEAAYILGSRSIVIGQSEKLKLSKSQGASTPAKKQRMQNIPYPSDVGSIMYDTRYVFVLNGDVVDWKSTKQSILATSSINVEYIAAFDASKEAVWIRKFISGLGIVPTIEELISMYCDNTGAIATAKDDGVTKGARHFYAKVHYLRETIKLSDVKIEKIDTDDNLADPFTKALSFPKHFELSRNMGLLPASSFILDEAVWICKFISGLGIVPTIEELISMYCDNTGAIATTKDDGVTKGARHFYAKVHYLCETIKLSDVKIEKIDTDDNLADPFTKALSFPKHFELSRNMGLLPASSFILPSEIGNQLPNLEFLQLTDNELTGVLPPSISNCSKLVLLEM